MKIEQFFEKYPNVAIAFSGGVDSAFLVSLAQKYAKKFKAYFVKTIFQPQFELEDARKLALLYAFDFEIINLDIMRHEIVINDNKRCYYCKKQLFLAIIEHAQNDGFNTIIDGTNASDDESDRPGIIALKELGVLSPLKMCGYTKNQIRSLSKELGLFTYNKPAYACLATRIIGSSIDERVLIIVEEIEEKIKALGFNDFRVRIKNDTAIFQINRNDEERLLVYKEQVSNIINKYYDNIVFDPQYRGII